MESLIRGRVAALVSSTHREEGEVFSRIVRHENADEQRQIEDKNHEPSVLEDDMNRTTNPNSCTNRSEQSP